MSQHNLYMRRCIDLALLAKGNNLPNPYVGSLVVYNNKIIGEGWHECYGEAHAEVNAINSVVDKSLLPESTLYVTLEPCFHYGKTPPCVDLIIKYKIPSVVIGTVDPYHEVAGKCIEKLKKEGVEVTVGILENELELLNKRFFTNIKRNRPYIVLKYAVSNDGFMGKMSKNISISGAFSKRWVHKLRSEESAIMVATGTALTDNPQLNLRFPFGNNPIRVVLDRELRIPFSYNIYDSSQKTIVFTSKNPETSIKNVEFIKFEFDHPNFIENILSELYTRKISSILLEGGAAILRSFIENNLWDEAYIIRNKFLKLNEGLTAPTIPSKYYSESEKLDNDLIEKYINDDK